MANKEKLLVGVDVGSHAVKVCKLQKAGDSYALVSLGCAMLPPGAVEDGVVQEPEQVGEVISRLFRNLKYKRNTKVAISISGYSVIVKKIKLDVMEEEELERYLTEEAEQFIPFDIEDVYLDFQDLKTAKEEYEQTDIMLVAAKKDVVDGYLDMLHEIKVKPLLVDVDGFALENIWGVTQPDAQSENIALVDIGAEKMNINIIINGTSVLARDVVVGSQNLTMEIANALDLDEDRAEQLKLGILPAQDDQKEILEQVFNKVCTNWVFEVQKAIDLYRSKNPDRPLAKVVLSGGGSKVKGLAEFIGRETGLEVTRFNPFAGMKINEKKIDRDYIDAIAPEMAIAAGLAIRPSGI